MSFDQRGFYNVTSNLLKEHRKRVNMTQGDVADELDMPRATYANIESGRQRAPADVIWRLSLVFGTPIGKLLPEPIMKGKNEDPTTIDESNQYPNLNLSGTSAKV